MSLSHHNPVNPDAAKTQVNSDTSTRFAHELANLLDGSLRNLGLAISSLDDASQQDDHLLNRLQVANTAMHHMAELIHRWMRSSSSPGNLYHQARTLGETVDHAVRLLMPAAQRRQIDLHVHLDPSIATLPAGPVYPVIANALRNSIEAIGRKDGESAAIQLEVQRVDDTIELTITDTGPGLDPALTDAEGRFNFGMTTRPEGHGLGLLLCQDIAREMGGHIELTNHSAGGVVFVLRYPTPRVTEPNRGPSNER